MMQLDDARREYADWYVREQLARREAAKVNKGRSAVATFEVMGGNAAEWLERWGFEPDLFYKTCRIGDWLVAEAEYHRMHAEAILRSYGEPVLETI